MSPPRSDAGGRHFRPDQPVALGTALTRFARLNHRKPLPNCPADRVTSRVRRLGHHLCMRDILDRASGRCDSPAAIAAPTTPRFQANPALSAVRPKWADRAPGKLQPRRRQNRRGFCFAWPCAVTGRAASSAAFTSLPTAVPLPTDDGDRSLPHRSGQARLAAHENRDQRHADRRREMQQAGVGADDERCPGDETRHAVKRLSLGTRAFGSAAAIRPLRACSCGVPHGSTSVTPRVAKVRPSATPDALGHSFSARAVA